MGPVFVNQDVSRRLDRHAATQLVKRISLQHSLITAALDAGVPLRDDHIVATFVASDRR